MRTSLTLMFFVASFACILNAQTILPDLAYQPGESLQYLLYYGFINGGNVQVNLEKSGYQNKPVYHARVTAKTTGLADALFKVEDVYESFFDPASGLPYKSIRNIHEGRYRQYIEVEFDHVKNTLISQKSGLHKVPENTHDIVSLLYYFRRSNLENVKEGDVVRIESYFGDEIFPVLLRYLGKETIKTGLGKIPCLKFAPVTEVGRMFKTKDDMLIWFSADAVRLPVRIKMNLAVGSVKCDLTSFSGLRNPLIKVE